MSSLLGHGLASLGAYGAVRKPAHLALGVKGGAIALALGVIPDLDVIGRILFPNHFVHRGLTHSLVFALCLAFGASFCMPCSKKSDRKRAVVGLTLVCFTHLLLDYLMACGPKLPLLWPFSSKGYLSPLQIVPTAYYSSSFEGLFSLLANPLSLMGFVLELLIFGPWAIAGWVCFGSTKKRSVKIVFGVLAAFVSGLGLWLTQTIYVK